MGMQAVYYKGWTEVRDWCWKGRMEEQTGCYMNAVILQCVEQVDTPLLVVVLAAKWVRRIVRRTPLLGLVRFRIWDISSPFSCSCLNCWTGMVYVLCTYPGIPVPQTGFGKGRHYPLASSPLASSGVVAGLAPARLTCQSLL